MKANCGVEMIFRLENIIQVVCSVVLLLLVSSTPNVMADLTGSKHDFTSMGWGDSNPCKVCHTPHNANTVVPKSPLWNHTITIATYTPYSSSTLNASVGQPTGISKLCLSCHDGTIAVDSYGGRVGNVTMTAGRIGTNLKHHHPVSFVYDSELAAVDGTLFDPLTQPTLLGGTILHDLLVGGRMECSSCHDVHNQYNNKNLLKITDKHSALCLTCHDM